MRDEVLQSCKTTQVVSISPNCQTRGPPLVSWPWLCILVTPEILCCKEAGTWGPTHLGSDAVPLGSYWHFTGR